MYRNTARRTRRKNTQQQPVVPSIEFDRGISIDPSKINEELETIE